MKKAITIIAAMLITAGASAQEAKSTYEKQHSLEITTGYPSLLHNLEYPWSGMSAEMHKNGQRYKEYYQPGINIGYTYSWARRWELNTMINVHLTIMDIMQYPVLDPEDSSHKDRLLYDWDAGPESTERQIDIFGALCASVRYKWMIRDSFSLYSALGAGISIGFPIPVPYVAPVGIQFGKGKVYGIAELNVSAATTFGMAGIGIRL